MKTKTTTPSNSPAKTPPLGARGAIYIAGRVTGEDRLECAAKFATAQNELRRHGFQTINPLEVVGSWETPWQEAMKLCIKALLNCDAVFMLPCCAKSKGARLETRLASALGIPLVTQISSLRPFGRPLNTQY